MSVFMGSVHIDENGEFYSEDKTVRYRALKGRKLYDYQSSAEGKGEYMDDTDECGSIYGMKIPDEKVISLRKETCRLFSRM